METLYPFFAEDLGRVVLWVSAFAGLVASLFNGATNEERWEHAAATGFWGILAACIRTFLILLRNILLGIFVGTMIAGGLIHFRKGQEETALIVIIAGTAAFIADPLLRWLKENALVVAKKVLSKVVPGADSLNGEK